MDRAGVRITPDAFERHMLELEKEVGSTAVNTQE